MLTFHKNNVIALHYIYIIYTIFFLDVIEVNGLVGLAVAVTMLTATTINPADPSVLGKMTKTVSRLDRSKHPHAIQNQHCYLCEVNV